MTTAMVQTPANASRPAEGRDADASIMERVIAAGDLSRLEPRERVSYYMATCRSVGLNPLTRPFDYLQLNGKLTLYSNKNCTDQLRQVHGISVRSLERVTHEGVHIVTAHVVAKDGREDEDIGAVSLKGLQGEALANALMKATTKAKRRATLSICGLSFLDETEIETIPDAKRVTVDDQGVIVDSAPVAAARAPAQAPKAEEAPSVDLDALYNDFATQIGAIVKACGTKADLKKIGLAIAKSALDKPRRMQLSDVYDTALHALGEGQA
jgi:hypothetical protein